MTKIISKKPQATYKISQILILSLACYMVSVSHAFALTGYTPVGIILCNVATMVWSDIGRGLATLAVISVGIMASIGKASWGQALLVAVGISLVFGAPVIVPQLFLLGAGSFLTGFVFSCI